jgi:hypothetical protein
MTTTQLILIVAVIIAIIAVLLASRGGPRVTTIEHKTNRAESHEGEEP